MKTLAQSINESSNNPLTYADIQRLKVGDELNVLFKTYFNHKGFTSRLTVSSITSDSINARIDGKDKVLDISKPTNAKKDRFDSNNANIQFFKK